MYYVYVHTVPNGKQYIGKAKDLQGRWNHGEGYINNAAFYADIKEYGWDNIKHEIIAEYPDNETASKLEAVLIALFKTENKDHGYNQTTMYEDAMRMYAKKVEVEKIKAKDYETTYTFFEEYGIPRSACREIIDQWIFNKLHREIAKDRLLDDMSYDELSEKYGKSVRAMKNIIHDCQIKIARRL